MKLSLEQWAARKWTPAPAIKTLRRWAREGRIHPRPMKLGRNYFVDESADYYRSGEEVPPPVPKPAIDKEDARMARLLAAISGFRVQDRDELRKLPEASKASGSGLYFLWDNDELVYVGEAKNVWSRLSSHRSRKEKTFTRATFLEADKAVRKIFELHYISFYRPKFNKAGIA